jgi:hypothetical protein
MSDWKRAIEEVMLSAWISDKKAQMRLQIGACIVLASVLAGCSALHAVSESFSHVITTEVEYYTTGPQQGRPPDGKFRAGTKVNIVQEAGSYT